MKSLGPWVTYSMLGLPLTLLLGFTALNYSSLSLALVGASIAQFLIAWWACSQLFGLRSTRIFAAVGLLVGWFAEQMGSSRGWFFGRYVYTDVLGPRLGDVPLVIPLMWFALCFVGLTLAKLMLWRDPMATFNTWPGRLIAALLAAMLVTAFDLGADPYFVFVLKAWIMQKTDGGWFGETLQGFAGWMLIAFVIVLLVQWLMRSETAPAPSRRIQIASFVPIAIYAGSMLFQMMLGHPIETRAIAFFAMGIPVLTAAYAWWQWRDGASR
ncbi:carotenoid biosynthesis protein [Variovorax sp. PCZ-1]|uniref:carotenoid biosynthesis protein n=1 Tax=Variovorax sp. PCZ-1 TaxID=2835533 RepID=UPI001BCD87F5|nr:carotenoid biosynthesis protein [Variovorax sp. PCZ-1]MBS7808520.1 carotenoid biosynthesis protein [Variovorax sp. PCZ-1]